VVDLELRADDRGLFARTYCREEFLAAGLEPVAEQCNLSWNRLAGTLRGMHWQLPPATEAKLVRCTAGAVRDVVVDVRPGSATYLRSVSVELTADNRRALYVPPMFAHGYQTLVDGAEVAYQVSEAYTPGTERGLRHDDHEPTSSSGQAASLSLIALTGNGHDRPSAGSSCRRPRSVPGV
jgi:dTDP-4-dehydrorhamnose 3,5-epimerase